MKADVAKFVAKCLTCQQVKALHYKPGGMLQPMEIPEWKWEHITMDFVMGLPRTQRRNDTIWVIVDRLTKSAHFLAVRKKAALEQFAGLYVQSVLKLHGVPVTITSDRDPRFTAAFWRSLQLALGTKLQYRWSVRKDHSDARGYATSLCTGFQGKLGRATPLSQVCL